MPKIRQLATKPWVVMPLVAVLVIGGYAGWKATRSESSSTGTVATEQVIEATTGTMSETVTAEGTVAVAQSDELSFSSAGTVTAVNVVAGQQVVAGDVLATIDSAELEASVADAETTLAEAEAKLSDDQSSGASSAQIAADRSSITSAQDKLDAAVEDLAGAQLVATFDGTVSTVDLTVGEELSSDGAGGTERTGSNSGSGMEANRLGSANGDAANGGSSGSTAQITVVSVGRFEVELGFDDTEIADLAVGQTATVSLSTSTSSSSTFPGGGMFPGGGTFERSFAAGPQATQGATDDDASDEETASAPSIDTSAASVTGTVTEVGQVADTSSGVAKYPVTIAFADASGDYNAGATVSIDIAYTEVADAVQVPAFAVTTTDGKSTVQVRDGDSTETRTVTTGLTSATMVQVTSGLDAGEAVVITMPGRGPGGSSGDGPDAGGGMVLQGGPPTGGFGQSTEAGSGNG